MKHKEVIINTVSVCTGQKEFLDR